MHNYKTEAIVLRTYDFNEADKIVILYSKDYGLLRAVAKGAKKIKSRLGSRIEPLVALDLLMFKGKNLDVINQCEVINCFKLLRKDLKKITFGMYYTELVMAFGIENDHNAPMFYDFFFHSLKQLAESPQNLVLETLLIKFEYELISFVGYAPMLDSCYNCHRELKKDEIIFMESNSGSFICKECVSPASHFIEIGLDLYNYLVNISQHDFEAFNANSLLVSKAHNLMYDYIKHKTNYNIKSQGLIESLCLA